MFFTAIDIGGTFTDLIGFRGGRLGRSAVTGPGGGVRRRDRGFITSTSARDDYGVALRDDLSVDVAATARLREAMRAAAGKSP